MDTLVIEITENDLKALYVFLNRTTFQGNELIALNKVVSVLNSAKKKQTNE